MEGQALDEAESVLERKMDEKESMRGVGRKRNV